MSCNSFTNNWDNTQRQPGPSTDLDRQELNNLMNMLNNPGLLKEGAMGALYGLLMYAANVCQQQEVKVRSEMAKQNSELTKAQGQVAQAQGDAIKAGAYAAAAGAIGSGVISITGAAASTAKMAQEERSMYKKDGEMKNLDKQINEGPTTQTTTGSNKQELQARKDSLARNLGIEQAGYQSRLSNTGQMFHVGSQLSDTAGQMSSANAQTARTLLETTGQQINQASNELQNNQKTAGDVADQLTQLLTLSGNLAKAAVGR